MIGINKKISLILCVVTLIPEIKRLLESLVMQSGVIFDLVVVDQSGDQAVKSLILGYSEKFNIDYHKVEFKGLSKSRNYGILQAKGDIVGFPDDDCWYHDMALFNVANFFEYNKDVDFISIKTVTEPGSRKSINMSGDSKAYILPMNIRACSITLFARNALVTTLNGFDERLGAGTHTPFKASEEEDLVCRSIQNGFFGFYIPIAEVYHPLKGEVFNPKSVRRWVDYSCGKMACQLKNREIIGVLNVFGRAFYSMLKPIITIYAPRRAVKNFFEALGTIKAIYKFKKYY